MKLWICVCLLMVLCLGCKASVGSFSDDSLDLTVLSKEIDNKINSGEWDCNPLQMSNSFKDAEMIYGIDETLCVEILIRRAIMDAACEEIVLVRSKENHQQDVIKRLQEYQQDRLGAFDKLPNQQEQVKQAQIVSYGNYVVFVCSNDRANVLQYMRSLTE